MKHLFINTTDPTWAAALAFALRSAMTDRKDVNPPLSVRFAPTTPLMAQIGRAFQSPPDAVYQKVIIPDEAGAEEIDLRWAQKTSKELALLHGMAIEPHVGRLPISHLAVALLMLEHSVVADPGYWFPPLPSNVEEWDAACPEDLLPHTLAFLKGAGIWGKETNILNLTPLTDEEQIVSVLSPRIRLVVCRPGSPAQLAARTTYRDFDSIMQATPTLCVMGEEEQDPRTALAWPAQLTITQEMGEEGAHQRGTAWAQRKGYGFDYAALIRDSAKQRGAQEG